MELWKSERLFLSLEEAERKFEELNGGVELLIQ